MSGKPVKWTMATVRQRCKKSGNCLLWTGHVSRDSGYPYAGIGSRGGVSVRRYVFSVILKRDLPSGRVVSSTCGHKICLSPDHLISKTRGEVLRDAYRDGIRSADSLARLRVTMAAKSTKLSPTKAAEIRASAEPSAVLAKRYGVNIRHIQAIRRGEVWRCKPTANASIFNWAASYGEAS